MVGRAVKTQDPMLLRVAHNLSRWTYGQQEALEPGDKYAYRGLWAPFVPHFYKLLVTTDQQDVLVEVAGTLANFTPLDLPRGTSLREIAAEYGVAELLRNYLVPNFAEDDTVMHVVMLIGALALDPDCAPLLAGSRLPVLLHDVLRGALPLSSSSLRALPVGAHRAAGPFRQPSKTTWRSCCRCCTPCVACCGTRTRRRTWRMALSWLQTCAAVCTTSSRRSKTSALPPSTSRGCDARTPAGAPSPPPPLRRLMPLRAGL